MTGRVLIAAAAIFCGMTLTGCRSVKNFLNPPRQTHTAAGKSERIQKKPSGSGFFRRKETPPPSMLKKSGSLNEKERNIISRYRQETHPGVNQEELPGSAERRNWVFGY